MNETQYNRLATKQDIQEVLGVIRDLMEHVDARFTALEMRMDSLERRMDAIELRMDAVEKRLDSIKERLDAIDGRLDSIEDRLIIDRKDSANVQHWAHKVSKKVNVPFRAA